MLLASHPLRQRRREAAEILEKVLVQPAPSAEDRFLAAKLYIGQGDWVNASRHFRSLLTQDRKTAPYAQYLLTYISALLARQETPEAELWLPGLEAIAPEQWTTTMLRASRSASEASTTRPLPGSRHNVGQVANLPEKRTVPV